MFPIWDRQETPSPSVAGFGASEPKYLNSPDTPVFHKASCSTPTISRGRLPTTVAKSSWLRVTWTPSCWRRPGCRMWRSAGDGADRGPSAPAVEDGASADRPLDGDNAGRGAAHGRAGPAPADGGEDGALCHLARGPTRRSAPPRRFAGCRRCCRRLRACRRHFGAGSGWSWPGTAPSSAPRCGRGSVRS